MPVDVYKTQKRGGRGVSGMKQREEDFVSEMFICSTHDNLSLIHISNYAVSLNDAKPILTGELFDIDETGFNMVAIDGFRLAVRHEKLAGDYRHHFVVPSKALLEASRLLKEDAENDCEIYVNTKHILFDINGYRIFTRLLEGEYHNYRNSIPKEYKTEVFVNTREIVH